MRFMIELLSFLKHRLSFIVFYVITVIIIACVMYLAGLDMTYARYYIGAYKLFLFAFHVSGRAAFLQAQKKYLKLSRTGFIPTLRRLKLPPASDAWSGDYIRLMRSLEPLTTV
jgi:hypothetical protein